MYILRYSKVENRMTGDIKNIKILPKFEEWDDSALFKLTELPLHIGISFGLTL